MTRDLPAESRDACCERSAAMPWRCTVCGAADIVAVRPGSEPVRDLFLLKRDIPLVVYCRTCWNQRWRARAEMRT